MPRVKVTATIDDELVQWLDKEVEKRRFRNRSHGIEYAIAKLKESDKK
jgi:Arc/MetJ-type ribon-helix-helix transcriptional regulator